MNSSIRLANSIIRDRHLAAAAELRAKRATRSTENEAPRPHRAFDIRSLFAREAPRDSLRRADLASDL